MTKGPPRFSSSPAGLACAGTGGVKVNRLGAAARPARDPACELEFLRKPPERAHLALAELSAQVTAPPRAGAREVLRAEACALGADAVVVTKEQVTNEFGHVIVAGTAIAYEKEDKPAANADGSVDL